MTNLEEVFGELREYDKCLNPKKCTFGVGGDKFLGFMITHQGIEVNPNKCIAILEMCSPTNIQEVLKLNGILASQRRGRTRLDDPLQEFPNLGAIAFRQE